jgi:hypothetical protein
MDLLNQSAPAARAPMHQAKPSLSQASFGSFGAVQAQPPTYAATPPLMASSAASPSPMGTTPLYGQPALQPARSTPLATPSLAPAPVKAAGGGFDDLWKSSLGTNTGKATAPTGPAKSIKDLTNEKAHAGIWGTGAQQQQARPSSMGSFGAFAQPGAGTGGTSASGGDDLLL